MVSVNLHNIQELLPEVEANIEKAAFIAIDTEFSGLNVASVSRESRFDEAEHRYDRLRRNVTDASLLQLDEFLVLPVTARIWTNNPRNKRETIVLFKKAAEPDCTALHFDELFSVLSS